MPILATRGGGSAKGFGLFGGEAPQVPFISNFTYLGTRLIPGGNVPNIWYANNQYIAIQGYSSPSGYLQALYSSSDGTTWTLKTSNYIGPTNPRFFGYTSAGYYVLAGTAGRICYSTDLINWTFRTVNASAGSFDGDVSPSNGMLFADYDGKYAYMTGGDPTGSWTTGTFSQTGLFYITWAGGNNWVSVNAYATGTKGIYRMTSLSSAPSNVSTYIPYAAMSRNKTGSVLIAINGNSGGDSRRSADGGASWGSISLGYGVYGQMDADTTGNFYAGGYTDNKLIYSTSAGSSWSSIDWNARTNNTGRVAAGASNTAFVRTYGNLVKATNSGTTLTNQYSDYGASGKSSIQKIGYGNGKWLISKAGASESYIATSTDNGVTWTDNSNVYSSIGRSPNQISYELGYYWCGFGNSGAGDSLAYSSNGTSWTKVTRPAGVTAGISGYAPVVSNGSNLACTFDQTGKVWYSTSLPGSWSAATIAGVTSLNGIAYGNGVFVVTDDSGGVWTSTNGSSWTARTSGVTASSSLCWSSKAQLFLMYVEAGNTISTSPDGITWTSRILNDEITSSLFWGTPDGFVGYSYNGNFITSTNGRSWAVATSNVTNGVVATEKIQNVNSLATDGSGKYIILMAVEYGLAST